MATTVDARLARYSSPALALFRIVFGLMFAVHGAVKLFDWPIAAGAPIPLGAWPAWWAGLIELVAGLLVAAGLFTRVAAFIAAGEMAVAYFWMHWPPLADEPAEFWPIANAGEPAVLYCFGFLLLAATGAGMWSVDARRDGRAGGVGAGPIGGTAAPMPRGGVSSRFRRT